MIGGLYHWSWEQKASCISTLKVGCREPSIQFPLTSAQAHNIREGLMVVGFKRESLGLSCLQKKQDVMIGGDTLYLWLWEQYTSCIRTWKVGCRQPDCSTVPLQCLREKDSGRGKREELARDVCGWMKCVTEKRS